MDSELCVCCTLPIPQKNYSKARNSKNISHSIDLLFFISNVLLRLQEDLCNKTGLKEKVPVYRTG